MAVSLDTARAVWFTAPRAAELRAEPVGEPGDDQLLVRGVVSLISAGTEMLIYRGEANPDEDLGLETCEGSFAFPVKYAYQIVGRVEAAGALSGFAPGDLVFARHPHQDLFLMRANPMLVFALGGDLAPERAAFANLLDVALSAMLDVPVRIGDAVAVYGQGVVGSLCAQLARRTAGVVVVVDPIASRRQRALGWGADAAVDPGDAPATIEELTQGRGVDVAIEVSGAPSALQAAIEATGQEGTVAAMSFFGTRDVTLRLAPEFHYRRQRIVSAQVSSVGSGLQPRWSFERRMGVALDLLRDDQVQVFATHRFPFDRAPDAYELVDRNPDETMGVLLTY